MKTRKLKWVVAAVSIACLIALMPVTALAAGASVVSTDCWIDGPVAVAKGTSEKYMAMYQSTFDDGSVITAEWDYDPRHDSWFEVTGWRILTGNLSSGTSISTDGMLTVAKDEANSQITIEAYDSWTERNNPPEGGMAVLRVSMTINITSSTDSQGNQGGQGSADTEFVGQTTLPSGSVYYDMVNGAPGAKHVLSDAGEITVIESLSNGYTKVLIDGGTTTYLMRSSAFSNSKSIPSGQKTLEPGSYRLVRPLTAKMVDGDGKPAGNPVTIPAGSWIYFVDTAGGARFVYGEMTYIAGVNALTGAV